MRVLVCGGRNFSNRKMLYDTLNALHIRLGFSVVIEGEAKGADLMSKDWAEDHDIEVDEYPAKWRVYGKSAGYKRNTQMLVEGKPDLVVAFPGGRGTAMMVEIAKNAGVEVMEVK